MTRRGSDKGAGGMGDGNQPTPSSSKRAIPITLANAVDTVKKRVLQSIAWISLS